MVEYDSNTAIIFVLIALAFAGIMAFVAWRVIRNLAQEDEEAAANIEKAREAEQSDKNHADSSI
ncbi:MAG: hypothetical protein F4W90_06235 [Gammaproteobacteria bacterium]|nr:hypothetical protein [Gammaproteobacteria bacterium]